ALVIYDHLATLSRELDWIWNRKFTSVTLLFHLNRWTILLYTILNIVGEFLPITSLSLRWSQRLRLSARSFLFTLWAVFSAVRMYALSRGDWRLTLAVFALSMVPGGVNAVKWQDLTINADVALTSLTHRICAMAADLLIILVTWYRTFTLKRASDRHGIKTPLITLLLRDGIWHDSHLFFWLW
ncbi:hypothetical protein OBBRIDRAFT_735073, partial [Obba rivulosa]